jgi:hypothetical protein
MALRARVLAAGARGREAPGFRRCIATAAALALAVLASAAAPAHAQVINREHFAFSFSEETELCGIAVQQDTEVSGTAHERVGKRTADSAFFAHVTYQYTDTFTNPATGEFLVIEGHALFQDIRATRVEGTVFQFTSVEAGQVVVLRDSSGRVVLRDRGVIRSTLLFDTLGDDTPGGEEVGERLTVRLAGRHPSFDEDAFCAAVEDLIG